MKKITTFIIGMILFHFSSAQVQFSISSASANSGENVTVDVRVSNFVDITSMQFSINWEPDIANFVDVKNISTAIPQLDEGDFGDPSGAAIDEGELTLTWNQTSTQGVTIDQQNHLLFSVELKMVGAACDLTDILFTDDPRVIEFIDSDQNLVAFSSTKGVLSIPGTGCNNGVGDGEVNVFVSNETASAGGSVCFEVTVDDFADIILAQVPMKWNPAQLTNGAIINEAFDMGGIAVINDALGTLRYLWSPTDIEITPESLPNGTKLFDICFDVLASSGSTACINVQDLPNFELAFLDSNEDELGATGDQGCATIQGGSNDVTFYVDDVEIILGANVCVPIKVRNFKDIQTFQYAIEYNPAVLNLTGFSNFNTTLAIIEDDLALIAPGNLRVTYVDLTGLGKMLDNDMTIFEICFDVAGTCDSKTDVIFTDNGIIIEVSNSNNDPLPYVLDPGELTIICPCKVNKVNAESNNVSCFAGTDGKLTVIADGGNGNYTYNWNNTMTGSVISNLGAAFYTVTVTDGANCNTTGTFQITQPAELLLGTPTIVNETTDCNGSISINVTGGTGVKTYLWSDDSTINSPMRTALCKGDYSVIVTDANGCSKTGSFKILPKPLAIDDVVIKDVSCNGGSDGSISIILSGGCAPYTFTGGLTDLPAGSYTITITDASTPVQTVTQTYPIAQPDPIVITLESKVDSDGNNGSIDVTVVGGTEDYTYLWTPGNLNTADISNLPPGNYSLKVTDMNGCMSTATYVIGSSFIEVTLASDPENIYNGSDVACAGDCNGIINGTVLIANGNVSFTLNGAPTTLPITGLCPGNYKIGYTDENGLTGSQDITLVDAEELMANFTAVSDCSNGNDGTASINVSGGTGSYSYEWSGTSQTTASVTDLDEGSVNVLITDENGCQMMIDTVMNSCTEPASCFESTPIITPNGDNRNDQLIITCLANTNNKLLIFDRFGRTVFEKVNYDNTWEGISNAGNELEENGYMWVLEVIGDDGSREIYKGTVTILKSQF